MVRAGDITALVLAGGRGSRMGGLDKGLQLFQGQTLVERSLDRLRQQDQDLIGPLAINANRNLQTYEALNVPVWPDASEDFAGPLAGFLVGMNSCSSPYLLTVPCDTPLFPLDLAARLAKALSEAGADLAIAAAPDGQGVLRPQPVFCLMRTHLRDNLTRFIHAGGHKVGLWTSQQRRALVPFDLPGDNLRAFANTNTLAELRALEHPPIANP